MGLLGRKKERERATTLQLKSFFRQPAGCIAKYLALQTVDIGMYVAWSLRDTFSMQKCTLNLIIAYSSER